MNRTHTIILAILMYVLALAGASSTISVLPVNSQNLSQGFNVWFSGSLNLSYGNTVQIQIIGSNNLGSHAYTINAPALEKINNAITLGYNSIYSNALYNLTVSSPALNTYTNTIIISTCGTNTLLTHNSNSIAINIISPPCINANRTLQIGSIVSNTLYNFTYTVGSLNALAHDDGFLEELYNIRASEGCAPGANIIIPDQATNNALILCTKLPSERNTSLLTLIDSYALQKHNITASLGQSMLSIHEADNMTALSEHQIILQQQSTIQNQSATIVDLRGQLTSNGQVFEEFAAFAVFIVLLIELISRNAAKKINEELRQKGGLRGK